MATQGERRALMFLAAVAVLGAGTRACRAKRVAVPTEALDQQITAIDSAKPRLRGRGPRRQPAPRSVQLATRIDLDVATVEELVALPGVGPSLARRIVDNRTANGPFGCLAALDRVKGVGPALLARLDSVARFSAAGRGPCGPGGRGPG